MNSSKIKAGDVTSNKKKFGKENLKQTRYKKINRVMKEHVSLPPSSLHRVASSKVKSSDVKEGSKSLKVKTKDVEISEMYRKMEKPKSTKEEIRAVKERHETVHSVGDTAANDSDSIEEIDGEYLNTATASTTTTTTTTTSATTTTNRNAWKHSNGISIEERAAYEKERLEKERLATIEKRFLKRMKNWTLADFEIGGGLGKGRYGTVWLARERITGRRNIVAMKVLFRDQMEQSHIEHQVQREVEVHCRMSEHTNVLHMFGYFSDEKRIYIVLEYAPGGELYVWMKSLPGCRLSEHQAARYCYQMICAIHHLHTNNVIHRDIKPENVLIGKHDQLKLADFGWAISKRTKSRKNLVHDTLCGTVDYLAPELIHREQYDTSVDTWSVGVFLYEMLVGRPPFYMDKISDTFNKIQSGMSHIIFPVDIGMSKSAQNLITMLLTIDVDKRLPLNTAVHHPFFKKNGVVIDEAIIGQKWIPKPVEEF